MTITETKAMVATILDLNEKDAFTYSPSVYMYPDGNIIVSCMVQNNRTEEYKNVQNFRGDIFQRIEEARNDLIANEQKFIEQRKAELEKELEKLNG